MKHILALLLSCFLFASLNGITPPGPIVGSPSILTPKFSASSGSSVFEIAIPSNWGLGNVSISPDGSGYFELYPNKGGNGCIIEIECYQSDDLAANALNQMRNQFKNTNDLQEGFEAELSQAWFSCRIIGKSLIQTWYSLPKKKREHKNQWKDLRNCVSVLDVAVSVDKLAESREPIKKMSDGWVFNHPTKNQFVHFKSYFGGTIRSDDAFSYLISFDDMGTNAVGYFYLEWDQVNLDTTQPYQNLANKISQEMKVICPSQSFDPIKNFPAEGYAIMPGYPYGIVIVSGGDFLFSFAVKPNMSFREVDVNALLNKVRWSIPK